MMGAMEFSVTFDMVWNEKNQFVPRYRVYAMQHKAPVNTPRGELLGTCETEREMYALCDKIRAERPEFADGEVYR